jgi:hypothetical protein
MDRRGPVPADPTCGDRTVERLRPPLRIAVAPSPIGMKPIPFREIVVEFLLASLAPNRVLIRTI